MIQLNAMLGFWMPGPMETIVILAILVLLFGRRLPEIARNMGKSLTEFKRGIKDSEDELHKAVHEADRTADEEARQPNGGEENDNAKQ